MQNEEEADSMSLGRRLLGAVTGTKWQILRCVQLRCGANEFEQQSRSQEGARL